MFYDEFISQCKRLGVKPSQVAADIGISKSTVSKWKTSGYNPSASHLKKVADYFGVDVGQLIGKSIEQDDRNDFEDALRIKFSQLSPEAQQEVIKFMDFKISLESMKKDSGN